MDMLHGANAPDQAPHTGTTIVACRYDGGVVIGADGRVSTGTYVSNRASDKLTCLADNVWLARSGSAADTQAIADYVRWFVHQYTAETHEPPSVKLVANLVMQMNYQNKHLVGAMLVAGWDASSNGAVYGTPIGGTIAHEPWAIDGSGSSYIWGYCDTAFKENMTREEAEEFVKEALALAMSRDGSSGGVIRLVTVNKDGAFRKFIQGADVPLFHEEIRPNASVGIAV